MSRFKPTVFKGAATALITPFRNGAVDYEAFGSVIEEQIRRGVDGLVIAGTTGEGSTLSHEEHVEVLRYAVEKAEKRVPIIAGTGSNDTDYAILLSRAAQDVGCDALLLVTPYYNKATPKGLILSFKAVADATKLPCILYHIPSRTGVTMTMPVYKELAKHERIVGVKEASGNFSLIAELAAECGDSYDIYSGNDDQIVPILSLGGVGVISVLSHLVPEDTHRMVMSYLEGNVSESCALQLKYIPLIKALFSEVNPIPVKTAMGLMGKCSGELRLPLCEMEDGTKAALVNVLRTYKLLK
ncbi:MAG: 4-hydroxy-tetrahydrodipicolinate synthase [Clostridia bacterium]|nr:4-hydroxy-tetrahydrodipicolinate synthase [Clostridia bacterium]